MISIDACVETGIAEGVFPGAAYAFGRLSDGIERRAAKGHFTYCPESPETQVDTQWDLASVSKVVATTTVAMILYDRGLLKLEQKVADVCPAFAQNAKAGITMRNLLVHDSGLIAFRPYHQTMTEAGEVWKEICADKMTYATGAKTVYSDLNMIALQRVLEKLSGVPLDRIVAKEVWEKLGMTSTLYCPGVGNERCAPTDNVEPWRKKLRSLRKVPVEIPSYPDGGHWVQGEVHDPAATVLGGVAGHAGLFSDVADLARFSSCLLKGGEGIVMPETIRMFTTKQGAKSTRALGWDTKSPEGSSAGKLFGPLSFGHTGYTGTSIWIDPEAGIYSVLLTNRVHPTSANTKIQGFRPKFHDAVWEELAADGECLTQR